ncbi:MAG TPA: glycoside hydrolase family 15 protein [Xanthobacteraceae bacterium]|nr:glycoside hydrolase family 15 protein [Xanthobacteraceae bacterium]
MSARLEDYAIIGDCETAALIARDGSVDWLCWPRFDAGACFAALLGSPDNGRWLIGAVDPATRISRRYRGDTLILETLFETASGAATITDFMPLRGDCPCLVRLVEGKRGRLAMRTEYVIRFDYGGELPWVTRLGDDALCAIAGPDMTVLRTPVELRGVDFKTVGEFTVAAGQTIPFVLSYGPSHLPPPPPRDPLRALADTEKYWRDWARGARRAEPYSAAVTRSLITVKALTHRPSGSLVAAPTTSLPERLGGQRNWDYRYCWLRDATFTLLALMNAGYYEDAGLWRQWLLRAVAGDPARVQIMYGLTGERRIDEWEIDWLDGYEGSKPVRAGNAAVRQLQIDVYGELMDVLHHGRHSELGGSKDGWDLQRALLDHLETVWEEADHGLWEARGDRRRFTHSKIMAWVAFDRAVKTVEQFGVDGPLERWRALRATIHDQVCRLGFNPAVGAFVQSYGSKHLDASALLIPLVGFLPADDPRIRSTIAAIQRHLVVDGLVMRYDSHAGLDGLPPGEGAFLPCGFWLADNLVMVGRRDEARALFEQLLSLRSDLGLLSEEYDTDAKRLIGNFPQALTHIALINTAYMLTDQCRHHRHAPGEPAAEVRHPLAADSE